MEIRIQIRTRAIIAILCLIALAIVYGLRVNISVAMVSMQNYTALETKIKPKDSLLPSTNQHCNFPQKNLVAEDGPFIFTNTQTSLIFSSYYWGYLIAMIPGGRISELWSAKWVMFFSILLNMSSTLLTPFAAWYCGYIGLTVCQMLKGLGGGVSFPCTHCMLSHWSPKQERSKLSSFTYAGTCMGTVFSQYMSGALSTFFGWASIFFVSGSLAMPWLLVWMWYVTDYPSQHRYIREDEKEYLAENIQVVAGEKPKLPWRNIAKSKPFWAILIAHACSNWGFYLLLIEMPIYMREILLFDLQENGRLSAIPHLVMAITTISSGFIFDYLIRKNKLSVGTARKVATGIASLGPGACIAIVTFLGCARYAAAGLLALAVGLHGPMYSGMMINHMDIAPMYAGTLMALTNIPGTISGIMVPIFVGFIAKNQTLNEWRIIYFTTLLIYIVEFTVFMVWSSGEEQPWNKGAEPVAEPTVVAPATP